MHKATLETLGEIESLVLAHTTRGEVIAELRKLGLSDFGLFLNSLPNKEFPMVSRLLPKMPKADIQISWTGSSGTTLLQQSIDFVRAACWVFSIQRLEDVYGQSSGLWLWLGSYCETYVFFCRRRKSVRFGSLG